MTIKGEASDEACLCTSTHTYLMRLAESSNTHYLLPGALASDTPLGAIEASILTHYELKPMVPRLVKLRRLLAKRKYEGFDTPGAGEADPEASEARQSAKRLTTSSLRAAVQCSEAQLDEALEAMHAVELQGEWRQLSLTYRHQITEYVLNLVDEHSWPRSSVGVRDVLKQSAIDFPDFAPEAVYHCMGTLSEQPLPRGVGLSAIEADLTFALDERKVSFFHAEKMLHEKKRWMATEFFDRWRADARGSVELDMQMLRVRARASAVPMHHRNVSRAPTAPLSHPARLPYCVAGRRVLPWRSSSAKTG